MICEGHVSSAQKAARPEGLGVCSGEDSGIKVFMLYGMLVIMDRDFTGGNGGNKDLIHGLSVNSVCSCSKF